MVSCWKVVKKRGRDYYSICADGEAKVHYPAGDWAEAPEWLEKLGYGLCVFDTPEAAQRFVDDLGGGEIWLASGEGEIPLPEKMLLLVSLASREITASYKPWPEGTRMYRKVQLALANDSEGTEE